MLLLHWADTSSFIKEHMSSFISQGLQVEKVIQDLWHLVPEELQVWFSWEEFNPAGSYFLLLKLYNLLQALDWG